MTQPLTADLVLEQQGLVAPGTRYQCVLEGLDEPVRLDRFLARSFPLYSRSFFKRLIDEGSATINGKQTNKQGTLLKKGDRLLLIFPKEQVIESTVVAEQTNGIRVKALETHFIIIDKPAGITVHKPHSSYTNPTVVDWLLLHHQEIAPIGYIDRPGIVHRLDKDTSGLMIIARTNHAHAQLTALFKNRAVHKTYLALVQGHPPASGTIDFQIGRHPFHRNKMAVFNCAVPNSFSQQDARVRDAVSHYKVLAYYKESALVEVKPTTGRTHQIRVHFAALGHPLLGDLLYGNKSPIIQRHALHAQGISFPLDGTTYQFTADMAPDFAAALQAVQQDMHS